MPLPPPEAPRVEDKPVYKQWWFWAIIGVGAIIVVDVAVNSGSSSSNQRSAPTGSGLALFHF